MIRGTTPTLEFTIPFDTSQLSTAFVTLSQRGSIVLDKALSECGCEGNKLSVRLTQEETLELECDCITEIQIRAVTVNGDAIASDIMFERIDRILKDGVI